MIPNKTDKINSAQYYAKRYLVGDQTRLNSNWLQYTKDLGLEVTVLDQKSQCDEVVTRCSISDPGDKSECHALVYFNSGWTVAVQVDPNSTLDDLVIDWSHQDNAPDLIISLSNS